MNTTKKTVEKRSDAGEVVLVPETVAAERLGVSPGTLQQWRHRGVGPEFVRIGSRAIRYRTDTLDSYMSRQFASTTEADQHAQAHRAR